MCELGWAPIPLNTLLQVLTFGFVFSRFFALALVLQNLFFSPGGHRTEVLVEYGEHGSIWEELWGGPWGGLWGGVGKLLGRVLGRSLGMPLGKLGEGSGESSGAVFGEASVEACKRLIRTLDYSGGLFKGEGEANPVLEDVHLESTRVLDRQGLR